MIALCFIFSKNLTAGAAHVAAEVLLKALKHVWVSLDLYEKDLARVHVGQEVEMRTDSLPGETFRGRVAFIVPVIDEATRTAKVRLEFPNPHGQLHAGQLVTARILADPKLATNEVLAVPRKALLAAFERDTGFAARFYRAMAIFLSDRLRSATTDGPDDELDEGLLDTVHQAGDRFVRLLSLLSGREH